MARARPGAGQRSRLDRAPGHAAGAGERVSRIPRQLPLGQGRLRRGGLHADGRLRLYQGARPAFLHVPVQAVKSTAIESVKYPLENRIWFSYPNQP